MAAYRRVYDSRHLQADCQEPGSAPEPMLGDRVWVTIFTSHAAVRCTNHQTTVTCGVTLHCNNVTLLVSQ